MVNCELTEDAGADALKAALGPAMFLAYPAEARGRAACARPEHNTLLYGQASAQQQQPQTSESHGDGEEAEIRHGGFRATAEDPVIQ